MNKSIFSIFKGDRVIWIILLFWALISSIVVFSSTSMLAWKHQSGNTMFYFIKHVFYLSLGSIVIFVFSRLSYKLLFKFSTLFLAISCMLLLLTPFLGVNVNGASRWLKIPFIEVIFQPSDMAKCFLVVFLAKNLSVCQDSASRKFAFLKCAGAVLLVCGLIVPSNFSTSFLVGLMALFLMFVARIPVKYLLIFVSVCIFAFFMLIVFLKATGMENNSRLSTWAHRIEAFTNPNSKKANNSQAMQSRIAIAQGGIIGKGIGASIQRNILPHPYSDFVYAIIVEETGLVGGVFVLMLYLIFFYRCIKCVNSLERTFPAFLVVGFSLNIMLQALANMLVSVNIMPVTGQTLPLVSMGGTSIVFTSFQLGVILNITRYAEKKEDVVEIEDQQNFDDVTDYPIIAG